MVQRPPPPPPPRFHWRLLLLMRTPRPRRRPPASGRSWPGRRRRATASAARRSAIGDVLGVERADDRGELVGALRAAAPRRRAASACAGSPKRASTSRRALAVARRRRGPPRPTGRRPRPSARPGCPRPRSCRWSMIPTRSASTSASSRYCVVRKTVTPSSRARRPTSAHSAVRLCGSRPVVGSSRNRIAGRCTSASARSRRRFMPPE